MAARRLTRALLTVAAVLVAPWVLYKGIELVVAERLGLRPNTALPSRPTEPTRAAEPTASPQAKPAPATRLRAVALVVRGFGPRGVDAAPALGATVPLTLAVQPFTPFALRISRAAPRHQKEVLIDLGAAPAWMGAAEYGRAALGAVWWPVGLLAGEAASELPESAMAEAGLLLLDSRAPGPATAVPRVEADARWSPSGPDRASENDPAVLLVEANELSAALQWLADSGSRPLFLSEAVIERLGTRAALPRR